MLESMERRVDAFAGLDFFFWREWHVVRLNLSAEGTPSKIWPEYRGPDQKFRDCPIALSSTNCRGTGKGKGGLQDYLVNMQTRNKPILSPTKHLSPSGSVPNILTLHLQYLLGYTKSQTRAPCRSLVVNTFANVRGVSY